MGLRLRRQVQRQKRRRGSATIDYFLVMAVVMPMMVFIMKIAPQMMQLVYDLLTVVVSWPFM